MKTQTIEIDEKHDLVFERMYQEQLQIRVDDLKALVDVGKAHLREKLMENYPDIDWGLVHDIRFSKDGIELITFEHPMEQFIGPMTEDEQSRAEKAREIAIEQGVGKKEENLH